MGLLLAFNCIKTTNSVYAIVTLILFTVLALGQRPAQAQPHRSDPIPRMAQLTGQVRDKQSSLPVADAQMTISTLGLHATSDHQGRFALNDIALPGNSYSVTITVRAAGYGVWQMGNVRLHAADTLILAVQLSTEDTKIHLPPPRTSANRRPPSLPPASDAGSPQLAYYSILEPPPTIRVRITSNPMSCNHRASYTVATVNFKDYVKHVLPNEWGDDWHTESLRAGAMAAKAYAWHRVNAGGQWPDADIWGSTCDQVYRPEIAYASTNAAVDATWDYVMLREGAILFASYRNRLSECPDSQAGSCLGQWESKAMAEQGQTWQAILAHFYHRTSVFVPGSERLYLPRVQR